MLLLVKNHTFHDDQVRDFVHDCFSVISKELFGTRNCPCALLGPWIDFHSPNPVTWRTYQVMLAPSAAYEKPLRLDFLFERRAGGFVISTCRVTTDDRSVSFVIRRTPDPDKCKFNWTCTKRFEEAAEPVSALV